MKRASTIQASTGNVFADLGDPQAPETLLKSRLAQRLAKVIEAKGLSHLPRKLSQSALTPAK